MDFNLVKEVANLGGELVIVVLFLIYLVKKDEMNKITYDTFNQTINNHLHHSSKVIESNSKVLSKVAVNLKELSLLVKKYNGGSRVKS